MQIRRKKGSLLGSLTLSCTCWKPHLVDYHKTKYSVGVISRYMEPPRETHLEGMKQFLRYVNSTTDLGLLYKRYTKFVLYGFISADFSGGSDDRISTLGYVFFFWLD